MLEGAEVRLAVDIGGTFTDIVLDVGLDRRTRKVLTTLARPEQAVLDGMRLILADAIWYAQDKFNPSAVIDLATLTGAIIVALGHELAGLYSNDDDLANAILAAGQSEGEPLWRMPLGAGYDKQIDSPNADMKNKLTQAGFEVTAKTGKQHMERVTKEVPMYKKIIQDAGIKKL